MDDYYISVPADEVLKAGATLVSGFTLKDEEKKRRAAAILVADHGEDMMYWSPWIREPTPSAALPSGSGRPPRRSPSSNGRLQREDECATDCRLLADASGLARFRDRLARLAADHAGRAGEARRMLDEL